MLLFFSELHTALHATQFSDKELQLLNTLLLKTNLLTSILALLLHTFWNDFFVHLDQTLKISHSVGLHHRHR